MDHPLSGMEARIERMIDKIGMFFETYLKHRGRNHDEHEDRHQLCGRVFHAAQAANERPTVQEGNFDKCSLIHRRT